MKKILFVFMMSNFLTFPIFQESEKADTWISFQELEKISKMIACRKSQETHTSDDDSVLETQVHKQKKEAWAHKQKKDYYFNIEKNRTIKRTLDRDDKEFRMGTFSTHRLEVAYLQIVTK